MKEIYGEWSWERRAIIVVVGGRRIAASMAGMPHGAGLIKDNDFPGHFCVHFWAVWFTPPARLTRSTRDGCWKQQERIDYNLYGE